jgi:hypothetical protein
VTYWEQFYAAVTLYIHFKIILVIQHTYMPVILSPYYRSKNILIGSNLGGKRACMKWTYNYKTNNGNNSRMEISSDYQY